MFFPKRAYVCEKHFLPNQFENSRADGKRPLRWNAIPTIFSHRKIHKERKHPTVRCNNANTEEGIHARSNNLEVVEEMMDVDSEHDDLNSLDQEKNQVIIDLRRKLKSTQKKLRQSTQETENLKNQIQRIFNDDQIEFLKRGRMTGRRWQTDTIKKSLKLYLTCNTTGYEELRKQGYPLPCIRTLQQRMEDFKFHPGILSNLFPLLKAKVDCMNPNEKYAVLLIDEMAIKSGLQYDNSTGEVVGRPTIAASGGKPSKEKAATHALFIMIAGLTTRWKQTIAYDYTENSYDSNKANEMINNIIKECNRIGLNICAIVSDMGPQNQALWRLNHIVCSRYSKTINYCMHPCSTPEAQKKLYFMPDTPHVFKNLRLALTEGHSFYLSDEVVKRFNLESNEINIDSVKVVISEDKKLDLKMAPRLKENMIKPGHFDKMNVGFALAVVNRDVGAAIRHYIGENKLDRKHLTTAWFFEIIHKWFYIMNGRTAKLALSHNKEQEYQDTISFLNDVVFIVENIKVGRQGIWKPFQTGVVLATKTVLDIQDDFINKNDFQYLMLGRFTQDALENLFSNVRSRNAIPENLKLHYD